GNSDDIILGTANATAALAPGDTVVRQVSATVPFGVTGHFHVFFRTDRASQVFEGDAGGETNNLLDVPIDVLFAPPPSHLVVDAVTVPSTAETGSFANITWRVSNIGSAASPVGQWSDRIVLSSDDTLGNADDISLGTIAHTGALASGGSYSQ